MWGHSEEAATCKPGLDHPGTLISNSEPPELGEINGIVLVTQSVGFYYSNLFDFEIYINSNQDNVEFV